MHRGTLKIHSENILPIIKKWLYSEKDIFVRELVSNACDALSKVQILGERGEMEVQPEEAFRIDIVIDKDKGTLTFSDNGIGMDAKEVEEYIAQLAFSGAEEFVKKYSSEKEEDQMIGHFGLGFYSSYMVAKHVEIETLSYKKDAEAVFWSCDGSSTYMMDKGKRTTRGTDITLFLAPDEGEYLEAQRLRDILNYYCSFLPFSIYLNGSKINEKSPLWLKPASECTDNDYLDFYRTLFPNEPDPIFWIHLNVDYPFNLKGVLYFPKISREQELKKESIKLYCNRVFVSDQCKDLLPEYLMILRGAIDSPDIPLNVSRSYLQMDKTVRQLGGHISKKISDRLSTLYKNEKDKFLSYWEDLEMIIKFGALQDEKFYERIKEFLVWKNTEGQWTTVEEYHERNTSKTQNVIYYAQEEKFTSHFLDIYRKKGIEVLVASSHLLDQSILSLLERKTDFKFQRIDAHLHETLLDPSQEKMLLDAEGKTEGRKIAELFQKKLDMEVEAKSLATDSLPAFLMLKEEERRFRDSLAYHNKEMLKSSRAFMKPTFVVNTNSKLIHAIYSMEQKNPELAKEMAMAVYDLTLLSQKEMEVENLPSFVSRNTSILEKLANFVIEDKC